MDRATETQLSLIRELADLLGKAHLRFWLRGGWAVDFLLGEITRRHSDIDLVTWLRHRQRIRRTLLDAGFLVDEVPTPSSTVRLNRVISQEPSSGLQYEQGRTVRIEVSGGPEQLPVPDVTGKGEDDARTALEQAGFRVAVRQQQDSENDPGTVLAQDPASGRAARGSTVTITVAVQPKRLTVPDVVGRSQNNATKTLSGRGFEVGVEEVAVDTPVEDGLVQKQSPAGDKKVDRGSTVTITIGRFDPTQPAPGTPPPASTTTTPAGPGPAP
jgi:serine/threonine-protein kinase